MVHSFTLGEAGTATATGNSINEMHDIVWHLSIKSKLGHGWDLPLSPIVLVPVPIPLSVNTP